MCRQRLWLAFALVVLLLAAGCGEVPTAPPGQALVPGPTGAELPPRPTSYPPPPTVSTLPPVTPEPTWTAVPPPTVTPMPTPFVAQATPYAPVESLPANFPPVAYVVQRPGQPAQLWRLRYAEGMLREELLLDIAPSLGGYCWASRLAFSPDGRYIALNLEVDEGIGAALILRLADGKVYLPPPPVEGDTAGFLAWIPGSERFVWKGASGANWGTLAIDGSAPGGFAISDVCDAVVSLDGKRIIFSAIPSEDIWLAAVNVDGANLTPYPLPNPLPGRRVRNLELSPDSRSCVFTWDREITYRGAGQLWVMAADGSDQRALGPADTYDFDPTWSPDGRTIAFARWDNPMPREQAQENNPSVQKSGLWTIDVETGNARALLASEGQYSHWSPRWLPDGSGLVFLSNRGGEANLWFVRPDGTGLQQLTRQGGLLAGEIAVFPW